MKVLSQLYFQNALLRVDKLASLTPAYNSFAVFVYQSSALNTRNVSTSFGAKYIQKTVSYLNLFTDFNLLRCITYHEKSIFLRVNWLSSTHFSPYFAVLISQPKEEWTHSQHQFVIVHYSVQM